MDNKPVQREILMQRLDQARPPDAMAFVQWYQRATGQ